MSAGLKDIDTRFDPIDQVFKPFHAVETHVVAAIPEQPGRFGVRLNEFPLKRTDPSSTTIPVISITISDYSMVSSAPGATEFCPDWFHDIGGLPFRSNLLYFHPSKVGTPVTVDYYGGGSGATYANLVFLRARAIVDIIGGSRIQIMRDAGTGMLFWRADEGIWRPFKSVPAVGPELGSTAVLTQDKPPGAGILYGGVNQNLTGHWVGSVSTSHYGVDPPGAYAIGDTWWEVTSVIDGGTWLQNGSVGWSGTIGSDPNANGGPACGDHFGCGGFDCSSVLGTGDIFYGDGYTCSPHDSASSCYYYYQYDHFTGDSGCYFGACAPGDIWGMDCYFDRIELRYYFDVWSPSWTTYYDKWEYYFVGWHNVGSTSVATGASPVFS